jgi:hypothetical protein
MQHDSDIIISDTSCLIILEKIKSTNFRFNEKLFETVLELAGE